MQDRSSGSTKNLNQAMNVWIWKYKILILLMPLEWLCSESSMLPPAYGPLWYVSEMVGVLRVSGQQGMQINARCNLWVERCSFRSTDLHGNVLYRSWVWTNSDTCLWCGSASANCSIKVPELKSESTFQSRFIQMLVSTWEGPSQSLQHQLEKHLCHVQAQIRVHPKVAGTFI